MDLRLSGFRRSCAIAARRGLMVAAIALGCVSEAPAQAERPATPAAAKPPAAPERGARRLFERFVEDAAVTPGGWVEAQYRYANLPGASRHDAGPLIAFKVVDNMEAGLRFGYTDVNSESGAGGSGLSDIDLYAKYRLPGPKNLWWTPDYSFRSGRGGEGKS